MLAANLFYHMEKIVPRMMGRPFCMDVKLDGERMLCHREGTKVVDPLIDCFIGFELFGNLAVFRNCAQISACM